MFLSPSVLKLLWFVFFQTALYNYPREALSCVFLGIHKIKCLTQAHVVTTSLAVTHPPVGPFMFWLMNCLQTPESSLSPGIVI